RGYHRDLHSFPTRRSSDLASRGLAHLNVSPDNLFVAATPTGEQVKLLGLGTAVFRPRGAEAATAGGDNARFRAPEVAAGGEADSDRKSTRLNSSHDQISYA